MVSIHLNGERRTMAAADVTQLVAELEMDPRTVLIEHNGQALHRHEWSQAILAEDDCIEILRVVAGG